MPCSRIFFVQKGLDVLNFGTIQLVIGFVPSDDAIAGSRHIPLCGGEGFPQGGFRVNGDFVSHHVKGGAVSLGFGFL